MAGLINVLHADAYRQSLKRLKNSTQRIAYFSMLAVQTMGADVKHGAGLEQLCMSSQWSGCQCSVSG